MKQKDELREASSDSSFILHPWVFWREGWRKEARRPTRDYRRAFIASGPG